jgi:hypothetical protein
VGRDGQRVQRRRWVFADLQSEFLGVCARSYCGGSSAIRHRDGSPHYSAMNIEKGAPKRAPTSALFQCDSRWWLFCLLVFTIKFLLLLLDPSPKLFMGDSGSYISTALTGWIPPDRPYFYGYTVRWLAVLPKSFTPLLIIQALAGGITAIVFAVICSRFFEISTTLSFFFGLLSALDPCQVIWERYVMTETLSLLVYVLVLYGSLSYLRKRRIWQLAVVQVLSVVLIGFRMSYLLVVQACTFLLPAIAFAPSALLAFRNRSDARVSGLHNLMAGGAHVIASVAIMFVTHNTYMHVNGWLLKREPAYLYRTGYHLASVWSPALQPGDATDPRFRDLIAEGYKFKLNDLRARNAQHFVHGFLIDRWKKIEKNFSKGNLVAKQTAMNALRHRPLQIIDLALKTYLGYWQIQAIQQYARSDLGYNNLTEDTVKILAEKFRFRTVKQIKSQPLSFLQLYFVWSWPYYFIVLLSPLTCALATWLGRCRSFALLLFIHASILMLVITTLSPQPCIRYLQPLSILSLFSIAICIDWIARGDTAGNKPLPARHVKLADADVG